MRHAHCLWLLCALAGACSDTTYSSPIVTAQKWDPQNLCFATISGVGDPLASNVQVDMCPTTTDTKLHGGADQLRLVIDYGSVAFDAGTQAPVPTVSMTLDGTSSSADSSVTLAKVASPTVFWATLTAPAQVVHSMDLSVAVATGYVRDSVGPFSVTAPTVVVDVQQCASQGSCALIANVDTATVNVTAPGSTATTGTITSTVEGVEQSNTTIVQLAPVPGVIDQLSGTAFVSAPATRDSNQWVLTAQVGAAQGSAQPITLHTPTVSASIGECASQTGQCTLTADVGAATIIVSVPGISATTGSITSSLSGLLQPGATTLQLAVAPGSDEQLTGIVFVPIPKAPEGTQWDLTALVGSSSNTTQIVLLHAPSIKSALAGCMGTTCSVSAKESITLTVTVPLGMVATQATVVTITNNVAAAPITVDLSTDDLATSTKSGTTTLTAPDTSGDTWLIDVNVDGYSAQTITATVP